MNYYTNKINEHKIKHAEALELGEDKEAAAHLLAIDNYTELNKQVKG